jgi:membrane associated rhomboid family serine protease
MMQITPTVKQLLIINIIFFIGSQIVPQAYEHLSLFYIESNKFQFWQLLTHMFMHAPMPNIMHIAFNMFALYSFGSALEQFWGGKKFLFFYISCGLGAALMQSGINYYLFHSSLGELVAAGYNQAEVLQTLNKGMLNTGWATVLGESGVNNMTGTFLGTMVGASGAIYGLLIAFAFMFPNAQLGLMFIPIPIKAKYFVTGLLAIDLFLGVKGSSIFGDGGSGIAHFAHVGGALVGFLIMWFWKKNQFHGNRWD